MRTLLATFALAACLFANPAGGDPRKERLYSTFIAPCCWRENLLAHHSPKADELRGEIDSLIAAGRTDEEIKAGFVQRHSLRILALPEGARGEWLAWTPWAALLVGLTTVAWFIRRSRRLQSQAASPVGSAVPDLPAAEDWL